MMSDYEVTLVNDNSTLWLTSLLRYTLLTCAAVFVDLSSVLDTHEMLLTRCLQARVLCPIQGS